jgi:hypothetical protein
MLAGKGRVGNRTNDYSENSKGRVHVEDLGVDERMILK